MIYLTYRWKSQRKTCGSAHTDDFIKSSALRHARFPSESIALKKHPTWTRHMWVARLLIRHLVLVECLENIKIACDCNQRWVSTINKSKIIHNNFFYILHQLSHHSHFQKKRLQRVLFSFRWKMIFQHFTKSFSRKNKIFPQCLTKKHLFLIALSTQLSV